MAFIKGSKQGIFVVVAIMLLIGLLGFSAPAQAATVDRQSAENIQELPGSTSQLPLISFLGFGMLAGGLISVRRTRPEKQAAEKF